MPGWELVIFIVFIKNHLRVDPNVRTGVLDTVQLYAWPFGVTAASHLRYAHC